MNHSTSQLRRRQMNRRDPRSIEQATPNTHRLLYHSHFSGLQDHRPMQTRILQFFFGRVPTVEYKRNFVTAANFNLPGRAWSFR
jgi:hypothetical protein